MKVLNKISIVALTIITTLGLAGSITQSFAATTPSLGAAASYGVLSDTFNYNIGLTTITGVAGTNALGYVGIFPGGGATLSVIGLTQVNNAARTAAGIAQNAALSNGVDGLNDQVCTSLGAIIDLATFDIDGAGGPILPGHYPPGCYSSTDAMNIGGGGTVILDGAGTYIFRPTGALGTTAGSSVILNGASECDVFWAPTAATTLGANSTFIGTVIDAAGITIGNTVNWLGRALAYGGTITADTDTITVPVCNATLRVNKTVVNTGGGTKAVGDFPLFVNGAPVVSGVVNSFPAGAYTVTETTDPQYTQAFSNSCDINGNITLLSNDDKTCTITNTYIIPPAVSSGGGSVVLRIDDCPSGDYSYSYYDGICGTAPVITSSAPPVIVPLIGILKVPSPLALPNGSGSVTYSYTVWNVGGLQSLVDVTVTDDKCSVITLVSGDVNNNKKLEPSETWKYTCTSRLLSTTTNTAIATGYSNDSYHQPTIATAVAMVVVGASTAPPLINIVKVPSRLTPFPFGGGDVTYTYTVKNPGIVPMHDVTVIDDKCSPVSRISGDTNNNNLFEPSETWVYTCKTRISKSTRNIATAEGQANGLVAKSYAIANVLVAAPGLPKTGLTPQGEGTSRNIALLASILAILSASFLIIQKKRKTM